MNIKEIAFLKNIFVILKKFVISLVLILKAWIIENNVGEQRQW